MIQSPFTVPPAHRRDGRVDQGAELREEVDVLANAQSVEPMPERSGGGVAPGKGRKTLLLLAGGLLAALTAVIAVAFGTARHWTAVDAPGQPETFSTEEYRTGLYVVLDDGVDPCSVGQDWVACINSQVKQFNGACTKVRLTPTSKTLCDAYGDELERMKNEEAEPGSYVDSLGGYGHLTKYELTDVRRVSNNDFRAAETHDATCYLGFIGECVSADASTSPLSEEFETGVFSVVADGHDICSNLKVSECFEALSAEYDRTCGTLTKGDTTEESWNVCLGYAKDLELTSPDPKDDADGGAYSAFGSLTKIPLTAVRQVSATAEQPVDVDAVERARRMVRDSLNSGEAVKMRAQYKENLANGRTQDELVAELQKSLDDGLIAKPTACVLLGFIHNMPDDVIIETCSTRMEALLTGDDTDWGKSAPST